jgi:hypothetical protein
VKGAVAANPPSLALRPAAPSARRSETIGCAGTRAGLFRDTNMFPPDREYAGLRLVRAWATVSPPGRNEAARHARGGSSLNLHKYNMQRRQKQCPLWVVCPARDGNTKYLDGLRDAQFSGKKLIDSTVQFLFRGTSLLPVSGCSPWFAIGGRACCPSTNGGVSNFCSLAPTGIPATLVKCANIDAFDVTSIRIGSARNLATWREPGSFDKFRLSRDWTGSRFTPKARRARSELKARVEH